MLGSFLPGHGLWLGCALLFPFPFPFPFAPITQAKQPRTGPAYEYEVVATFWLAGEQRQVTRQEVALELARQHSTRQAAREALEHLIEKTLVREAAKKKRLLPSAEETRKAADKLSALLRRSNQSLARQLQEKRMSRAEFEANLALGLAQKRLAARALGIDPEKVTKAQATLWSKEARAKARILLDRKKLQPGVLARVDEAEITILDLGLILFMDLSPQKLEVSVQELVFRQCIAQAAKDPKDAKLGITKAEIEKHVQEKKRLFQKEKKSLGLSFEEWLMAFGSSIDQLRKSPRLRAQILHRKLVRRRYKQSDLDSMIKRDREGVRRRHGARRNLSIILVRATKRPNQLIRRDFDAARKYAESLRQAFAEGRSFAQIARTSSDDPFTKVKGGEVGWVHRDSGRGNPKGKLAQEVLEAAFELELGRVTEPVQTKEGLVLAWVSGIEPEPDVGTLRRRLLNELAGKYTDDLLAAAKIKMLLR